MELTYPLDLIKSGDQRWLSEQKNLAICRLCNNNKKKKSSCEPYKAWATKFILENTLSSPLVVLLRTYHPSSPTEKALEYLVAGVKESNSGFEEWLPIILWPSSLKNRGWRAGLSGYAAHAYGTHRNGGKTREDARASSGGDWSPEPPNSFLCAGREPWRVSFHHKELHKNVYQAAVFLEAPLLSRHITETFKMLETICFPKQIELHTYNLFTLLICLSNYFCSPGLVRVITICELVESEVIRFSGIFNYI